MSFSKHLACAVVTGAVLVIGASVQAKGPHGVGHGATPTFTPGAPHDEGADQSDWSGAPPRLSLRQGTRTLCVGLSLS